MHCFRGCRSVQLIPFVPAGGQSKGRKTTPDIGILAGSNDWKVESDIEERLVFPVTIAVTQLRPDIVLWSAKGRTEVNGELTVPWEDNMQEAYERKKLRYAELVAECVQRGWRAHCYPFEVGCQGFIRRSLLCFLRDLGIVGRECKAVCRKAAEAAEGGSAWI